MFKVTLNTVLLIILLFANVSYDSTQLIDWVVEFPI